MLKAKLLNSDAELNDYEHISAVEFVPGENLTIAFQIFHSQKELRHVLPIAATVSLTFKDSDGEDIDVAAAVINADDRSMWSVDLSQAETATLAGQSIEGEVDYEGDASVIYKFVIQNGVIRINLDGDC